MEWKIGSKYGEGRRFSTWSLGKRRVGWLGVYVDGGLTRYIILTYFILLYYILSRIKLR
jgi:hypothetical protein